MKYTVVFTAHNVKAPPKRLAMLSCLQAQQGSPSPLPKPAPSIWNAGRAGGDFSQLGVRMLATAKHLC